MSNNILITSKQLKSVSSLIQEEYSSTPPIRAYSFDWDDNIINMPTKIKMLRKTDSGWEKINVSTKEFALLRGDENYKLDEGAFDNFINEESFLTDLEEALQNNSFAPSFNKFKEALIYANPISIITARGHNPAVLRKGMDLVISYTFSEEELAKMIDNIQQNLPELDGEEVDTILKTYLDSHDYHPVTSEFFTDKFGLGDDSSVLNPEENKKIALRDYVTKIVTGAKQIVDSDLNKLSIGFSDDDLGNINAIKDFIEHVLQHEFPNVNFVVYDTSEGGMNKIVLKQLN